MKSVGLNESDRRKLIELSTYFSGTGSNPYSVSYTLTYIYSKLLNLKPKLIIKKASDEFKIRKMRMYRFKKQYEEKVKSVCNELML